MTTINFPSTPTHLEALPAPAANPAVATAVLMLSSLPPLPPPDPEADAWAEKINEAAANGIEWLISAGMHLQLAKQALNRGRWEAMFDSGKLKMGLRSAEMLMKIARHPALAQAKHIAELPPTLTALYALSGGTVEAVTAGIQRGTINPAMTAKEARAYVRAQTGNPPTANPAASFDPDKRRNRVQQAMNKEAMKWPEEARCQLADLLEALAKDIRASVPPIQQP